MIIDEKYFSKLWLQYRDQPSSVGTDWRHAFEFIEFLYGDPFSETGGSGLGVAPDRASDYIRRFGHLHADLDPLGLARGRSFSGTGLNPDERSWSSYCGTLAVEIAHLDPEIADWVSAAFEDLQAAPRRPSEQVLEKLITNQVFEQFLGAKFPGKKRFGSEGADAFLPLLHTISDQAAAGGFDELIMASMHRGRLSILANLAGMDRSRLFSLMAGSHPFPDQQALPGDVPYHLGSSARHGGLTSLLLPNPSHLEAVNPVAIGYTRARQTLVGRRALALILHTDASVIGQGVNAELVQMTNLGSFSIGGAIHIIINNQVGFTTDPAEARSSRYCSGPWRAVNSLLLHANGDDVDAVLRAGTLALRFRERFGLDAVIDLVCYRANGHNEIDEPRFTQPLYYRAADAKEPIAALYERQCLDAGVTTTDRVEATRARVRAELERSFANRPAQAISPPGRRAIIPSPPAPSAEGFRELIIGLSHVPEGQGVPKMIKLMNRRIAELDEGVSWPLAEAAALAHVLRSGTNVRLCGQDVERGSFSQRHLAAVHPETAERQHPMNRFAERSARFEVVNSPLSEYAVLGFEYGFSLGAPDALCIWEAQFGDFANGAQIVIDQFIASAYEKWLQQSRLVVLLPHGLEGQGPEHSSARIERLLQLCAGENIRVVHPTTPANYFHLLREHAGSGDRPLFILTPKMLLRLPQARSMLADFVAPNGFRPVISESSGVKEGRAVLCSGKLAYEIEREKAKHGVTIPVIRLEQLYPFPEAELEAALRDLAVQQFQWVQEEPANFGAALWLGPPLQALAARLQLELLPPVARAESASPAGSFHGLHERDQRRLILKALHLESRVDD